MLTGRESLVTCQNMALCVPELDERFYRFSPQVKTGRTIIRRSGLQGSRGEILGRTSKLNGETNFLDILARMKFMKSVSLIFFSTPHRVI